MAFFGSSWKDDMEDYMNEKPKKWTADDDLHAVPLPSIKEQLDLLTDEERLAIFSDYCKFCGSKIKPCYCHKDD